MQNLYFQNDEFDNIDDVTLIKMTKSGDKKALNYLLNKYTDIVNMKAGKYFIIGAEKEDIMQEGLIGLFKAIKSFDPDKQSSFKTFANLCVERQLQTAIKTSTRQKHMPLNSYLSLNISAYDENDDTSLIDIFDSNTVEDPLDTITQKEYYNFIEERINETLSDFEKQVLHRYTRGESYVEIADKLNAPVKSVDNAIQRIRKKTIKNILNYDDEEQQRTFLNVRQLKTIEKSALVVRLRKISKKFFCRNNWQSLSIIENSENFPIIEQIGKS